MRRHQHAPGKHCRRGGSNNQKEERRHVVGKSVEAFMERWREPPTKNIDVGRLQEIAIGQMFAGSAGFPTNLVAVRGIEPRSRG
jgi:hypothetical protein